MEDNIMRDDELDKLLSNATVPAPANGFEQRLLARIAPQTLSNVIAFPARKKTNSWLIGLPLAASLAIGLWLGSSGLDSSYLPSSTLISDNSEDPTSSGFDDVAAFLEDSLT